MSGITERGKAALAECKKLMDEENRRAALRHLETVQYGLTGAEIVWVIDELDLHEDRSKA